MFEEVATYDEVVFDCCYQNVISMAVNKSIININKVWVLYEHVQNERSALFYAYHPPVVSGC